MYLNISSASSGLREETHAFSGFCRRDFEPKLTAWRVFRRLCPQLADFQLYPAIRWSVFVYIPTALTIGPHSTQAAVTIYLVEIDLGFCYLFVCPDLVSVPFEN